MLDHFTLVMEWKKLFHLKQCSGAKKFQIFGHSVLSPIVMFWRMKTYNFHASFTPKKIIGRLFKWNIEVKSKEGRHENWRSCQFIVTYRICNPKRGFQVFFAVKKMAFFLFLLFFAKARPALFQHLPFKNPIFGWFLGSTGKSDFGRTIYHYNFYEMFSKFVGWWSWCCCMLWKCDKDLS